MGEREGWNGRLLTTQADSCVCVRKVGRGGGVTDVVTAAVPCAT